MAQQAVKIVDLVRALVLKTVSVAGALIKGWRTYAEGIASKRHDVQGFLNMAEGMLEKYKKGEEQLDMVEMALTAAKQVINKDIEFDSYVVEFLGDAARIIDQNKTEVNSLNDVNEILRAHHEFDSKFVERYKKLMTDLSHFDNTVILNPPKGELRKRDDET